MAKEIIYPAVGDVVMLISGGPDMTVVKVTKGDKARPPLPETFDEVECWWFIGVDPEMIGAGTVHKACFTPGALVIKKAKEPVA